MMGYIMGCACFKGKFQLQCESESASSERACCIVSSFCSVSLCFAFCLILFHLSASAFVLRRRVSFRSLGISHLGKRQRCSVYPPALPCAASLLSSALTAFLACSSLHALSHSSPSQNVIKRRHNARACARACSASLRVNSLSSSLSLWLSVNSTVA